MYMMFITVLKKLELSFLVCDVPYATSNGLYISQLIRFARASSQVRIQNKILTATLLKQGYRYHNYAKPFLRSIAIILN